MVRALAKAEKIILEEMYPIGSRVRLEHFESDPYSKLQPGDLGTVLKIDDAGGIHVSWDRGGSLSLIYGEDGCKCLMKSEQMVSLFKQLISLPFEDVEGLKNWLTDKMKEAFPKISFNSERKGIIAVGLNVNAFRLADPSINVKYEIDNKGLLSVIKCGWAKGDVLTRDTNRGFAPRR